MTEENKVENSETLVQDEINLDQEAEVPAEEKSEVEVLAEENAELKNQVLKGLAEIENLRKRHQKEVADANKYAAVKFARDILPVQDNMQRALEAMSKTEVQDEALKATFEGIKMVSTQLENSFAQAGIKKIASLGEQLNPELHQAMSQVASEEESGTILQVLQEGYQIHDRVLRPAMVIVAQ
jgi:molecular chaperone GrpE